LNGSPTSHAVLILGRDAEDAASLLEREGIECQISDDFQSLCGAIGEDTGIVLATYEAVAHGDLSILTQRLRLQPPWSDLPFIVLTRSGLGPRRAIEALHLPELLGNVVFLERPLTVLSLVSAVRSSMRARHRQHEIGHYLAAQIAAVALRKSEAQFHNMADSVPALIWMTDALGHVMFANLHHELMFGRPVDSIIHDGWTNLVVHSDREQYNTAFSAAFCDRSPFRTETRVRDKSSKILWLMCAGAPRLGDGGEFQGYTNCSVDVTEARLASDALEHLAERLTIARDSAEQASRAKSRFVAGMSHELRTPLNGILGYAQLLHMEGGLNRTQSMRVDGMLSAGKHLLQMITSVLDLSAIEAEHVEVKTSEVDVRNLARACLDLVRPTAGLKALTLTIAVAHGTPRTVVTDPTRLRQVLVNLLGNAVKFTARGSIELRVRTTADGFGLRLEVADTGPGVAADQRQRLFQEFERIDTDSISAVEGAGLGLALSARLAVLIGGRLGHDDNPGGGSVFWLELPLVGTSAASEAAPAVSRVAPGVVAGVTRVLRVLVVDDVAMNRDIAGAFLRSAGHQVTCVESGAEAIVEVSNTDFDVVLMDVRMPEMDGLEATRRIRVLEGSRGQVPIVALTAQAFTDQIAECREAGMDSHLGKPFDPEMLLRAVQRATAARSRPDLGQGSIAVPAAMAASPSVDTKLVVP
jgi:PAS domain S-box-containing protein